VLIRQAFFGGKKDYGIVTLSEAKHLLKARY
jgi:hypothetical protein